MQIRAIRTLNGQGPQDTSSDAFKDLKVMTIAALYVLKAVFYAVKSGHLRLGVSMPTAKE